MRVLECNEHDLKLCKSHESIKHEKHSKVDYKNKVCVKPWGHEFLIFQNESIGIWFLRITREETERPSIVITTRILRCLF